MKVTVIPIVIGALCTVTKWLVQGLEDLGIRGWVGAYPKYTIVEIGKKYWEESWRLEKTCCHSDSCEKPSAKGWCEKFSKE